MAGWKKPSENKILGKSYTRLDGPIKATGAAKYSYDINLPGLLFGRVFRSKHANATIKKIDISAAEKMPGVKAINVTAKVGDRMAFAGQEIGALCATSSDIAEDAVRAIKIEYEKLPHATQPVAAMRPNAGKVHPGRENVTAPNTREQKDRETQATVDEALSHAKTVHEGTYTVAIRAHLSLETHGATCRWDSDDHLTCWASTQGVFSVRDGLMSHFKLPADNVHVITEVMGGGFGSKFGADYAITQAAELAKKAKAPVKLLLTREEEHLSTGNAPGATVRVKIAADGSGKLAAVDAEVFGHGGIIGAGIPFPYIYGVKTSRVKTASVFTNTGPQAAWRAPGHPQASFIMEAAMDDLATKMGIDPLELRLNNDPNQLRQAQWKEGARLIGWDRRNASPGQGQLAGTGRFKRGLGCGAATWGGGGGGGSRCDVTVNKDGTVKAEIGVQDIGTGTRTYVGSIVAEELGIPREAVKVGVGHSTMGPGAASGGSVTTGSTAPAVKRAAEKAKQMLLESVAARVGASVDDLDMADGKVFSKSDSGKSMTFKQACSTLPDAGIKAAGEWDRTLQQNGVAGAQFAEVEVDTLTGRVKPIKIVALQDGGVIMNRLTFESQINGGVIQGIGMALTEQNVYCQLTGKMLNANLEEYKAPGPMEMPEFVSVVFENPTAQGVSGSGEPTVIPTAGAIRNAVLNACGAHLYEAPMTPGRVLEALAAAKRGA